MNRICALLNLILDNPSTSIIFVIMYICVVSDLFICAIVLPQLFNVDHGVHTAALIHLSDGCDSLVLCIRPHSLSVNS